METIDSGSRWNQGKRLDLGFEIRSLSLWVFGSPGLYVFEFLKLFKYGVLWLSKIRLVNKFFPWTYFLHISNISKFHILQYWASQQIAQNFMKKRLMYNCAHVRLNNKKKQHVILKVFGWCGRNCQKMNIMKMWWNHDIKIVISWYNDNHMMKSRWWRKAASVIWLQKIYVCMKGSKYDISEISFNVKKNEQGKIGLLNYLKLQGWDEQYDSKLQLQNLYKTSGSKWWPIIATKSWPNFSLKILTKRQFQNLDETSASKSQLIFNFKILTKPHPRYLEHP